MNKKKRKFMVISILFVIDRLAINIAILFVISNSSSDNDSFPTIVSILLVTLTNHSNSFHSQLNKVHQNRIYCDIAMHTSEKDH